MSHHAGKLKKKSESNGWNLFAFIKKIKTIHQSNASHVRECLSHSHHAGSWKKSQSNGWKSFDFIKNIKPFIIHVTRHEWCRPIIFFSLFTLCHVSNYSKKLCKILWCYITLQRIMLKIQIILLKILQTIDVLSDY